MDRRSFLIGASAGAALRATSAPAAVLGPSAQAFATANRRWGETYAAALAVLAGNVQLIPRYDRPVLIEGASYRGAWMESGPHEGLVYRRFDPQAARDNHLMFFALQRADGQIPAKNKVAELGFAQIQMVVPIAATAWELARATGDDALLHAAYEGCARWDAWLARHRNTRGTGLVEGFCVFDTGHDNSPRWAGVPDRCPGDDAARCPDVPGLPRLCPDLSATVYGGRVALAAMARALGRAGEAAAWEEKAATLRGLILSRLYDAENAAFYDVDTDGRFVKVASDVISRVCGEHVADRALFETLWARQLHNPQAFWSPWPLASIALDDPHFVRPIPPNSWGGASQALTALRAGRWMEHYGRAAEFAQLMQRWCEAIQRDPTFRQQVDPLTGAFTQGDAPGYTPTALLMVDFTWRLAGVREEDGRLDWTVRSDHPAADGARFSLTTEAGRRAVLAYEDGGGRLTLDGRPLGRISGTARLITDPAGTPKALLGVDVQSQTVRLELAGRPARVVRLAGNQRIVL